ncbi:hypothetical protein SAMD00019534_090060 [Acytostelium subglobosum LB1]|uniref:hypothetical protein n=1 Tax=Acytostelium subglobosum LB1 TaxID=1410327 RepID=UPI000644851B|nr:hypothetical protein SAMD00019534_090060 [Acytostelium subglobosum LB1]GAM25831.1 hypothetical protein SAMD00019534_090060 [Acytostelium subglobosum LB1]|eukprot:XP_012751349.1 hypothetical protein SAMD00019534_090060 [Acytostelium subglobosum LB1]
MSSSSSSTNGQRFKYTTTTSNNEMAVLENIYKRIIGQHHDKVMIKDTGTSHGRGLFTKVSVAAGSTIITEQPFVSHPSFDQASTNSVCSHCLTNLPTPITNATTTGNNKHQHVHCPNCRQNYCSVNCKNTAETQYHLACCTSIDTVRKYCQAEKRRFPLLAAKIVARILLGYHFNKTMEHWENLQVLSFAKKDPPMEWKDDYLAFQRAMLTKESNKKKFNYEWFVRVMQILYINTVGIQVGATTPTAATPDSGIGLYYLASFINHSCEPNCFLAFPNDHTLNLVALKPLKQGDELTISYGDPNKDYVERQSHLFDNYGFSCQCPKCLLDLPSKRPKKPLAADK